MHGYGMLGDLLHLALYLLTIGCWGLLWIVCVFNARGRLKTLLGSHALLICVFLFPVVAAACIAGPFVAFGIENMYWALSLSGVGLPLAALYLIRRYVGLSRSGRTLK